MIKQMNKIALSSWKNKLLLGVIMVLSCFILYSFISDIYDTVQVVKLVHSDQHSKNTVKKTPPVISNAQLDPSDIFGENQTSTTRVNTTLILEGVVVASDEQRSAAFIAPQNGQSQRYTVGEDVLPGLKLESVYHNYVVLSRSGVKEKLIIDWDTSATTPEISLSNQYDNDAENIQNVKEIQEKLRALPQFNGFDIKSMMKQRKWGQQE